MPGSRSSPGVSRVYPVLVAQGDADHVIPRELLDRTWAYLHDEAGADTSAHRGPGGHGITPAALHELVSWIARLTGPAP